MCFFIYNLCKDTEFATNTKIFDESAVQPDTCKKFMYFFTSILWFNIFNYLCTFKTNNLSFKPKLHNMKKLFAIVAVAVASVFAGQAHGQVRSIFGIANHLGVDLNVGTTGIGFEVSTPITPFVQARAGMSFMPGIKFHVDSEVSSSLMDGGPTYYGDITLNGNLKRTQGSLIFNVYPLSTRFPLFVAVGAYFGGRDLIKIDGYSPDAAQYGGGTVEIGDYAIPVDKNGYVHGSLRTNAFRPYFGIGTGRPCPGGRLNFMWELGIQVQGAPKVHTDQGVVIDLKGVNDDDTFQKIMKYVKVYPVLKFTIAGRIF